ncbi:MAG: 4-phosphoerythronate dehydrogenase [Phycisphaerae bacterium]|nr:4-phosphoerythronate dehydrogenase [Phycisphaerae bacterium]
MKIIADQNIPLVRECFASLGEVVTVSGREIRREILADADVLLVRSITRVEAGLLAATPVKFVATATIGVEHVDCDFLRQAGIGFASAPGSNANSVSEWVTAALLSLARKYRFPLVGRSIGIVGVGNVGSRVEAKCRALGMKVVLNDPPLQRKTGLKKFRPLEEIFECDFITMHTPLTREGPDKTWHLADEGFFAAMKKGAFFINSSRGSVHDTDALRRAFDQGRIAGFVLDVWEGEPRVDEWLLRRAELSTPHIAGYSYDGKIAGLMMIYQAACRHFDLPVDKRIEEFLPPPPVPEIRIEQPIEDPQKTLHDIVQQVYAIHRDDFNMREILMVPAEQRGKFFDDLRKNYPVRREFQNTTAILPKEISPLSVQLQGLGFKVAQV